MATKTRKLVVEFQGTTFTRQTARKYSHVVVVRGYTAAYVARWVKNTRTWADQQFTVLADLIERGVGALEFPDAPNLSHHLITAEKVAKAREQLAGRVRGEYVDAAEATTRANYAAKGAQASVFAWCGRRDLALKQFSAAGEIHAEVYVVEVPGGAA